MIVAAGLPALPFFADIGAHVEDGDEVRVDFRTGEVENLSRDVQCKSERLPNALREIIETGGFLPALKKRLETLP